MISLKSPHRLSVMKICYLVFSFLPIIIGKLLDYEKVKFCENLDCDDSVDEKVCGVRYGDEEVIFKLFDNYCKLLKYGCQVDNNETYGIINMKHCGGKLMTESENIDHVKFIDNYCLDCTEDKGEPVCGIRPDGEGFRIRTFQNECQLAKYNCHNELRFNITDFFICSNDPSLQEADGAETEIFDEEESSTVIPEVNGPYKTIKTKNLVIVDGSMLDTRNINKSIASFFAATHVLDLPVRELQPIFNESTRKMMINVFGPIKVFTPWIRIPKNISDDYYHRPTLSSCYHKCPTKCPDTYAPVCGVPGIVAREPSLMFQNHCFMDVAQCKMFWEGKSYTAESSSYIESSFLFCLGDQLSGLYRFLPLIKTLQHMGRLKLKGHYRYKLKNMKFFNNLLSVKQPRIMG